MVLITIVTGANLNQLIPRGAPHCIYIYMPHSSIYVYSKIAMCMYMHMHIYIYICFKKYVNANVTPRIYIYIYVYIKPHWLKGEASKR